MNDYQTIRMKHLEYVRTLVTKHQPRLSWSRDEIERERTNALRRLLAYAKANSPWHGRRLAEMDPANFTPDQLSSVPIMSKQNIMDHWDEIVTDQRLKLDELNAFMASMTEWSYYLDEYQVFASGGSSGRRGVYVWDRETFANAAAVNFRYEFRDEINEGLSGTKRVKAVVTAELPSHASTPLFSVCIEPSMEPRIVPAVQPFDAIVAQIREIQPTHITGYSSVIQRLAEETLAGRLDIRPIRVSTNSEPLLPEAREAIEAAWQSRINNGWGSTEMGIHAVECDEHRGLHLSEDVIIMERVNEANDPVRDDEPSEKLLMTSLVNRTFPFIRYELTDCVDVVDDVCPCGSNFRMIKDVEGRIDEDFIYPDGVAIHPIVFRVPLGHDRRIVEYQVIQTDVGARILVVGEQSLDSGALSDTIRTDLSEHGLKNAQVTIERVERLERHSETGKLKRFIPLP